MHGLLMEVDVLGETSGMRANTVPGNTEMMLVGALAFPRSELEAECCYVGVQVMGFVEAHKCLGICHCRDVVAS